MNLTCELIETLSEKAVRRFLARMPTHQFLRADLKQEAAIAIFEHAPEWRASGGASLDTFTYTYARRAMQELCTKQAGPVSKPMADGKFEGTQYGESSAQHGGYADYLGGAPGVGAFADYRTPEWFAERRDADEIVRDFIERRMESFTGKGKLSRKQIRAALTDMIAGDTCLETARRYGCSKQRMSMLAAEAGI